MISEHKNRLIKLKDEGGITKNVDAAVDILFSLRVNALQTQPEHRRVFLQSLIKGDALLIAKGGANAMLADLASVPSHSMKQALSAVLSIYCSTGKGIVYLTKNMEEMSAIERMADILKDQDDGSVTQRFCLTAIQKAAIRSVRAQAVKVIECLVTTKTMIEWAVKFLDR